MVRAVATECRAEFVSVGISDIVNMYRGESERNLALIFEKARATADGAGPRETCRRG
jgi:transitional endoplasmic reticulum ATPase